MNLLLQINSEVGGVVCTSPFLIGENYQSVLQQSPYTSTYMFYLHKKTNKKNMITGIKIYVLNIMKL